ncbi:MAG: CinA family protein [Gammaproteobacteria bacterium]|nr:MAG: CinA family protein [Gammaproteobacteria bacterium]
MSRPDPHYPLAERLGRLLLERHALLATAESCTGGGLAKAVTEVPGSSGWFDRGFVTYSNRAKMEMLGVAAATLERHGAVSEAVALEMAAGALRHSAARLSVAITGIAGPGGGTPDKPVGTVWIAWAGEGDPVARRFRFGGDRSGVREQAVRAALEGLVARAGGAP